MTSLREPGERNFNAVSHKPTRAPIQSVLESWRLGGCHCGRNHSACCELDVVKYFRHQQVSNLNNAAFAKKRNSALLNDLTAFEEERCRQSKRKLDVLVRCMKLVFLLLCSVLDISFINS